MNVYQQMHEYQDNLLDQVVFEEIHNMLFELLQSK
jgi:hypothetical protein